MALPLVSHRFTVEEYHRLAEAGALGPDARVELIDGVIVDMTPISSRHQECVDRLTEILSERARGLARVRVQGPIRLGNDQEPQPDITLLRRRPGFYLRAHPGPDDVLLAIEVSDSSAPRDREIKLPRYGQAGVPTLWVVDLDADEVVVADQPFALGYRGIATHRRGAVLTLSGLPSLTLLVEEALGPRPE
jgi:Uma2 family endonuclease